uniref:NADP-dependent oxidoreductase domain-containing protein n=1 Tax=Ananas comosus var. bracteatus TaxID=296719 RepID=A0A6V7NV39_ANACO|nr:unnamed protein product [Ananas comosus var. bracteatus]
MEERRRRKGGSSSSSSSSSSSIPEVLLISSSLSSKPMPLIGSAPLRTRSWRRPRCAQPCCARSSLATATSMPQRSTAPSSPSGRPSLRLCRPALSPPAPTSSSPPSCGAATPAPAASSPPSELPSHGVCGSLFNTLAGEHEAGEVRAAVSEGGAPTVVRHEGVWAEMEECYRLGLAKAIGVSNFSCKKMQDLLSFAEVLPAVNQVEVNPLWQQKKLREYCASKGVQLCAYSPLGARGTLWGKDWVMECETLREIAQAKGKTLAQICIRWVYEQGDCVLVKSFNPERLEENLDILVWELSEEERQRISEIPQRKGFPGLEFISPHHGPYKSLEELWDGEI